ncbi:MULTISPECIES: DUF982 domain-containing protein [unclassified Mesorhizobium]|uniref:DUF982 domain-containing protein n=1 Tax=unclassified Mesorhizobium TaxID=325217 RepID=UPI0030144716
MDRLQFIIPVRISPEPSQPVTEIYSVGDAMTFLQEWPVGRQGPVYQTAMNACLEAMIEQVPTEDARKAFTSFARVSKILTRDDAHALVLDGDGEIRPAH